MTKNIDAQYAFLQNQMAKACFSKYGLAVNNKRINKIAAQTRYLEKMIRPDMKEAAKQIITVSHDSKPIR